MRSFGLKMRLRQSFDGLLLFVGLILFYFILPFLIVFAVRGGDISFAVFIERTQIGMISLTSFYKLVAVMLLFGAGIYFLIPPAHFRND